jgi:hypothetical protein
MGRFLPALMAGDDEPDGRFHFDSNTEGFNLENFD